MPDPCDFDMMLSAFLDGELSEEEAKRVTQHLESCTACRHQLAELSAADDLIRGVAAIEPSADFDRAFWSKVDKLEEQQQNRWWQFFLRPSPRPALGAVLAAVLVVGMAFLSTFNDGISLEDRFVAENVEFLNEYDLIHDLEILENWEALEAMEEMS